MKNNLPLQIKSFNSGRNPAFLKLKYEKMRADKYSFFRATTHLFYNDVSPNSFLHEAPDVWLCGDLHLENFGSYKGDNRVAYFSINDFDECILGPCLLDIVRMLSSIYVASRNLGISSRGAHEITKLFVDTYFDKLKQGYIRVLEAETTRGVIKQFLEELKTRKRKIFLKSKTTKKRGKTKLLIDNKHTIFLPDVEKKPIIKSINLWASHLKNPDFYKICDSSYRIAGTSSLGLNRYVLLVKGNGAPNQNYLLDIKETKESCLEKCIKTVQPKWSSKAQRIVEVQKCFLSDPPALLGSVDINKKNYVLKELQPTADRIDYTLFKGRQKELQEIIKNMACIYAWSNLRSSGRKGSAIADDLIKFAENKKKFKKKLINYAFSYSKKVQMDYQIYCKAFDKGFFKLT
jgi:uncharacterized protein (DUF2252 family)